MRMGLLVALLGVLVVAFIGMIGSRDPDPSNVATPIAHPRTSTVEHAAVTPPAHVEPAALEVAAGGSLETQRMLRARDFAALTRRIEEAEHRVEENIRREFELARVLGAFNSADPALTPLLDAWVAASPDSYAAHLARAHHFSALAWRQRGTKWSSQVSEEQRAAMRESLRKSVDDARAALQRDPKITAAHRLMIATAMAVGDNQACVRLADAGLAIEPASLRIRTALADCMRPRWGGSYAILEALAKEAARHVSDNPSLAAIAGYVDYDRGNLAEHDKRYDEALTLYTRALDAGEYWPIFESRARVYSNLKRYGEALADLTQGLASMPEDPSLLIRRAETLVQLARPQDAVADVRLVAELDPTDDDLIAFRNRENEVAAYQGHQLMEMTKEIPGAIRRLTAAVDLTGGTAEIFYWRGRAYLQLPDSARALQDFEEAIHLDPRHFESYRNVDYLLGKKGDWDGIIERWSRYIELEPMSGQAYLERGGARHHKGDNTEALADARRACGLGVREGCAIAQPAGG